MSFCGYKERIEYGDVVIIYLGFDCMLQFDVESGKVHQTKFGVLKHDSLVGVRYGSKVFTSRGYFHVLHPSPELWTANLPHRTQILYSTDISLITLQLDLKPGCLVVESGTGSASLSHAILRTIMPNGHLHTFDFHSQRVELAKDEFKRHGFNELVTVKQRDVCKDGFGLESIADAVFLDLPSPWEAVLFAAKTLIPGGRLCSFSPCIEQVQRSCVAMRENGFSDITTFECLLRPIDVRTIVLPVADLGFTFNNSQIPYDVSARENKPACGHIEIQRKKSRSQSVKSDDTLTGFRKCAGKTQIPDVAENQSYLEIMNEKPVTSDLITDVIELTGVDDENNEPSEISVAFKTGAPALQISGHTGFLTFATMYPQ